MDSLEFYETGIVTSMVYVTKQRLTAVRAVYLASIGTQRQNQDLKSFLCNSKTHNE